MILEFDRDNLKNLRTQIGAVLAEVEDSFGIRLDIGNIRYSKDKFTTKITGSIKTRVVPLPKLPDVASLYSEREKRSVALTDRVPIDDNIFESVYLERASDRVLKLIDIKVEPDIHTYLLKDEESERFFECGVGTFANLILANRTAPITLADFICWATDGGETQTDSEKISIDRVSFHLLSDEDTEAVDAFIQAVNECAVLDSDYLKIFRRVMCGDYAGATKIVRK